MKDVPARFVEPTAESPSAPAATLVPPLVASTAFTVAPPAAAKSSSC